MSPTTNTDTMPPNPLLDKAFQKWIDAEVMAKGQHVNTYWIILYRAFMAGWEANANADNV